MNNRRRNLKNINAVLFSLKNAYRGLLFCFYTQRNMVIHAVLGIIVLAVAFALKLPALEMIIIMLTIAFVLAAETFNTALEKAIDLFSTERNELAHVAKDIAAGAVLLASVFAVLVGIIILGPPLLKLLF